MKHDKFFALLLWLTAIFIAGCSAFFSVRGIGLLFAGSMLPVLIMASSLEVGKLMTASFLYRTWKNISLWLKTYLTLATLSLICITSMGIYGFLSDAFSKTNARISFYEENILQLEKKNQLGKEQIAKIESSASIVDSKSDDAIAGFQKIYNDYVTEQKSRQDSLNERLKVLDDLVISLENSSGGLFSSKKSKIEALKAEQADERGFIKNQIIEIDKNKEEEYKKFLSRVESYRKASTETNTRPDIDSIYSDINSNNEKILSFKESIKNTDIGSFKFIAASFNVPLEQVVKWFIIIIVCVFDPLAVSLIVAYHAYTGKSSMLQLNLKEKNQPKHEDDHKEISKDHIEQKKEPAKSEPEESESKDLKEDGKKKR